MSITNKLTYLEQTKEGIKQAIINKGVDVSDSDTFRSYIDKIDSITTGGGSSDCVTSVCFDEIGYTTTPQYMIDGVAYAKQIKDSWDASIDMIDYYDDLNLVYFPQVDTSNAMSINFNDCIKLLYVPELTINPDAWELPSFRGCSALNEIKGLQNWLTNESQTNIMLNSTFEGCTSLANIAEVENWKGSFSRASGVFKNCVSLTSLDLSGWAVADIDTSNMFSGCSSLTSVNLSGWNGIQQTSNMFSGCSKLATITGIEGFNTISDGTFNGCSSLTSLDFSNVKKIDLNETFEGCWGLTNLTLPTATDSYGNGRAIDTFRNCNKLTSLDLSGLKYYLWDTDNMFSGCSKLTTINFGNNVSINANYAKTMEQMFSGCSKLMTITGLENWDVSKITSMYYMFSGCSSLTNFDFMNNWVTSSLNNALGMFQSTTPNKFVINLDTSNVTDFRYFISLKNSPTTINITFDMSSAVNVSNFAFTNTSSTPYWSSPDTYILIKNIGTQKPITSLDFKRFATWSGGTTTLDKYNNGFIDTLITYSFDRTAANYSPCTISLFTQSNLTEEEIAQITAKGYTIA